MLSQFFLEMPSSFVLQAVHQVRVRRLVMSLRDGGLSLSSMHEEDTLVIHMQQDEIAISALLFHRY